MEWVYKWLHFADQQENISELKLANIYKFWQADRESENYDCCLTLISKAWCGFELAQFQDFCC
jgi:hypothetical protein